MILNSEKSCESCDWFFLREKKINKPKHKPVGSEDLCFYLFSCKYFWWPYQQISGSLEPNKLMLSPCFCSGCHEPFVQ